MRSARIRLTCGLVAVCSVVASCGSEPEGAAESAPATVAAATVPTVPDETIPASVPATDAPTTTGAPTTIAAAPTTTAPPPTTIPPTTVAPITVPATVPTPIAPPADTRGQEPVIEVGSIEIPKININMTMFEGIRLTTLDRGPGHWPGTALPGDVGNVVVAGHRTSHSKPFRYLDKLEPGDQVIFNTANGRFTYAVTSTEIVYPDAVHIINQTPAKTATLFACHPVGSTKQRIVVHLSLLEV